MRHRVKNRRLGCRTSHRQAMMRNMVTSLIDHGQIVTTVTRAKELRRLADRMVTLGKKGDLHARRQALSVIRTKQAVTKLFDEIAPLFSERNGGYTRIVKIGPRRGDSSMMAVIEFATESMGEKSGKKTPLASESPVQEAPSVIPSASESASSTDADISDGLPESSTVQGETDEGVTDENVGTSEESSSVEESEAAAEETAQEETGEETEAPSEDDSEAGEEPDK